MWPFDSTYKTSVATAVSRVVTDAKLPNAIKTGNMYALVHNSDAIDETTNTLVASLGFKVERMFDYAKEHYTHGLPSGQFFSAIDGQAEATAVLKAIHGTDSISLNYCHFRPPNMQHVGWLRLMESHGYNPQTNQLGLLSTTLGHPVYLDNMTVVIPASTYDSYSPSSFEQWGVAATSGYSPSRKFGTAYNVFRPQTPITKDTAATTAHVLIDYVWETQVVSANENGLITTTVNTDSFLITLDGLDALANYFQAYYLVGDTPHYWMYRDDSGTYPTLDNYFNQPPDVHGTFFPFVYFRYSKASDTVDKTTAAYLTSKKLLKYLNMDYLGLADAIGKNPRIGDVEQAMLVMAVPANSTDPLELRYLFTFFDDLYTSNMDPEQASIVIQDKRFRMVLGHNGLSKRLRGGSIGVIGTTTFELSTRTSTSTVYVSDGESSGLVDQQNTYYVHTYRKQVSLALYQEIQVIDLKLVYSIYGYYSTTGSGSSNTLLIPLDHSITSRFSMVDRETLYSRSLHYVFNSMVTAEITWYQSDLFKVVLIAVAVIMTFYSFGTSSALALSLAGGSVALAIAIDFVIVLLEMQVLKLVVRAAGLENSLLIAAILVIVSLTQEQGDAQGCLKDTPWAEQLLSVSTGLAKAVASVSSDMTADLGSKFESLKLLEDSSNQELTAANKLLENKNWLSPIEVLGESPNDFYNRTTHSGNVGMLSIGAISSYTDIALRLPKLNDTLGGIDYAA
jgi:hypothetical protein